MKWIRRYIQKWIDHKTKDVIKTNESLKEVISDLEQSKTIGELKERLENMRKSVDKDE